MSTLERAIAIAAEAHAGQVDMAGQAYILHPLRVMLSVRGETDRIVAVLHDVGEDCPAWPLDRFAWDGFRPDLIKTLRLLTRAPGASYADYIDAIVTSSNPVARTVKIADLQDHLHPSRLATLTPSHERRYRGALVRLAEIEVAATPAIRAMEARSTSVDSLGSHQHGNASPDLPREVADHCVTVIGKGS